MGNNVAVKLDRAHRSCCIGVNDVDGSARLDGGRQDLVSDPRVRERLSTFSSFKKDLLLGASFSAVLSDVVGFRLDFELIGSPASGSTSPPSSPSSSSSSPLESLNSLRNIGWKLPGVTLVKVRQIFSNDEAPPRITSLKGFLALFFLLKDIYNTHENLKSLQRTKAEMQESDLCDEDIGEKKAVDAGVMKDIEQAKGEGEEYECPICMERRIKVVPQCGHGLCKDCFEEWSARSSSCPTCRVVGEVFDAWVFPTDDDIPKNPDPQSLLDELVQAIHSFLVFLPRLETQWERKQRQLRDRTIQLARANSNNSSRNANRQDDEGLDEDELPRSDFLVSNRIHTIADAASMDEQAQLDYALALSIHCR